METETERRDRLRGLEEQRWCSVALGHDTLQTHTCTLCMVSYSQVKAADLQLRTQFPVKQWNMVQSTVKGTQHLCSHMSYLLLYLRGMMTRATNQKPKTVLVNCCYSLFKVKFKCRFSALI